MGGATLLFIIVSLCIVVLCILRQHHDKKKVHTFDKTEIELTSDIKMNNNPSYTITKQDTKQEDQYDYQYVLHNKFSLQDDELNSTIKMDSNPSYGGVNNSNAVNYNTTKPGCDAAIQPNPSYSSITKENARPFEDEDEDGYVDTNSQGTQRADYLEVIGSTTNEEESVFDNNTDDTGKVEVNNPFYVSVSGDVKLENNPSYNKITLGQYP